MSCGALILNSNKPTCTSTYTNRMAKGKRVIKKRIWDCNGWNYSQGAERTTVHQRRLQMKLQRSQLLVTNVRRNTDKNTYKECNYRNNIALRAYMRNTWPLCGCPTFDRFCFRVAGIYMADMRMPFKNQPPLSRLYWDTCYRVTKTLRETTLVMPLRDKCVHVLRVPSSQVLYAILQTNETQPLKN